MLFLAARLRSLPVGSFSSYSTLVSSRFASAQPRFQVSALQSIRAFSTMSKDVKKVDTDNTIFFLCDIQERFRPLIHKFPVVVHGANMLVDGAKALQVPIIATEQYPKALGHIVSEINMEGVAVFEKTLFSMCIPEVCQRLEALPKVRNVVLFGIEAHVCILQTALDLQEKGYHVMLVLDAVSSQRPLDRETAIKRMLQAGVTPTTIESVLFQLLKDTKHPNFKDISNVAKRVRPTETLD
eukprot:TRINITY_DN2277_c0_g1::TRINITY_DN2277_c0_g1_i1::g.6680::m.6680 TRINITY_DN2277_c0_g1::TRINITY_DN2277_c0_g1_i1::g.6680  ORF type:complete len:240 (-),score=67.37,sp/B5X0W9/ISOC1_SALSA/48.62/3e-53,Isochorismatase/PF00857.15/5.8e-25 TRINITY_DN2277_c0_g1_i1:508-1227(-)